MKYILHGDPEALQRPRFFKGHVVDVQRQQKYLDGIQIKKQHGLNPLLTGPLLADITFFMKMPRSHSEKRKDNLRGKYHKQRPDLDNLVKYILDVCNTILYEDDSLISQICAKKIWADAGKTELILTALPLKEFDESNQNQEDSREKTPS